MSNSPDRDRAEIGLWILAVGIALLVSVLARQGVISDDDADAIRDQVVNTMPSPVTE